jgi:hypothetical protein
MDIPRIMTVRLGTREELRIVKIERGKVSSERSQRGKAPEASTACLNFYTLYFHNPQLLPSPIALRFHDSWLPLSRVRLLPVPTYARA